jgi:hypothetical protein
MISSLVGSLSICRFCLSIFADGQPHFCGEHSPVLSDDGDEWHIQTGHELYNLLLPAWVAQDGPRRVPVPDLKAAHVDGKDVQRAWDLIAQYGIVKVHTIIASLKVNAGVLLPISFLN